MSEKESKELKKLRQDSGWYTVEELLNIFQNPSGQKLSRDHINWALENNQLGYMSPNNKTKYIRLEDYFRYLEKHTGNYAEVRK